MLVVGQQEEADHTVSVRSRFAGDEGVKSLDNFYRRDHRGNQKQDNPRGDAQKKNNGLTKNQKIKNNTRLSQAY